MSQRTLRTDLDTDTADRPVRVARTSLGDTLRSVVYFTPGAFDVLYVRSDLYDSPETAREAKRRLVEFEQVGFAELPVRTTLGRENGRSSIGDYAFTVRFHEDGFVVRVLQDGAGVLLTADSMDVNAFEEAASAVRALLG
jgi:hypothetical protein